MRRPTKPNPLQDAATAVEPLDAQLRMAQSRRYEQLKAELDKEREGIEAQRLRLDEEREQLKGVSLELKVERELKSLVEQVAG